MFGGGFVRGAFVRKWLCPDTESYTFVYNRVVCPMNCVLRRVCHAMCTFCYVSGTSRTARGCTETTKTGCTSDKVNGDTDKTCYCNGASFQSVAAVSVFALVVLAAVVAF